MMMTTMSTVLALQAASMPRLASWSRGLNVHSGPAHT